MNFAAWMQTKGLKPTSVRNYIGALDGVLSLWARDAGIIRGLLLDIKDKSEFDYVCSEIRQLPTFLERDARGHAMYSNALNRYTDYLAEDSTPKVADDLEELESSSKIEKTTRQLLINARVGQGKFRDDLFKYWKGCAVTGYAATPTMLIASHIKPWSKSSNAERLDPFNGLLLLPGLDRAFDQGFISFDDRGRIMISPRLINPPFFGVHNAQSVKLESRHKRYMSYHRDLKFDQFKSIAQRR